MELFDQSEGLQQTYIIRMLTIDFLVKQLQIGKRKRERKIN